MLPSANRMNRATEFDSVVRSGTRARSGVLVIHHGRLDAAGRPVRAAGRAAAPRVGLVVSRAVGGSVVRHRVSRRLRAQLAGRIAALPRGSGTVVRALPAAARATSDQLGTDLERALGRVADSS